MTEYKYVNKM